MSALALLLVFVLPSVAGAVLLSGTRGDADSGSESPDIVVARGVACGLATWLLGSGLLARTIGLTATTSWLWSGLVAAASLVVLLLPRHRSRLRSVLGPAGRRFGEVVGLTALVYVPLAFVVLRTSWAPLGSTPWYYYGLARQVAEAGSIPATSMEFGTSTPFLNDYHLFTTSTAMLLVQDPGHWMRAITLVTLVGVAMLGLGMVALTSALGAGRVAALFAVPLAIGTGIGPVRLTAYRPEGFALGLTVVLVALGVHWLKTRDVRSLVPGALVAAMLSQVHGIAAVMAAVMLAAAALVSLVDGDRREQLKRTAIGLVTLLAAVVVVGLVFREASGTATAGGLIDRGGLADPTWEFYVAARDLAPSMPQSNLSMIWQVMRVLFGGWRWFALVALGLAGIGLWRRRREPVAREVVAFTLVSLVLLTAIASVFMLGWQGYVPRRTGASRLVFEASLLLPPIIAIGLDCLARSTWSWRGRVVLSRLRSRRLAIVAVLTVLGMVALVEVGGYVDGQNPSREDLATWRSLPMTGNDVVLANGYTEGFIPDVTGAKGLLDGRAPYTFGSLLDRANGLFHGAQGFFTDPSANWGFLAEHDVTWVVVGQQGTYALGTGNAWAIPESLDALEGCSGLQRVAGQGSLTVFRVVDPSPRGC